jgi:exopolysaccharide biosynthesis polyprenyl glycosylphosphotransferase
MRSTSLRERDRSRPLFAGAGSPLRKGVRFSHHRRWLTGTDVALDLLMLTAAAAVAVLSARAEDVPSVPAGWLVVYVVAVLAALAFSGNYRPRISAPFLDDVRAVLGATALAAMVVTFLREFSGDDPFIAGQQVRVWAFSVAYVIAGRGGFELVQMRSRKLGLAGDPTLIVGAGHVGRQVAARLVERPEFGLRPVAFFDDAPLEIAGHGPDIPIAGTGFPEDDATPETYADAVEKTVRMLDVRHVIVTFSLAGHDLELALVRRCQELGVSVSLVPRLFEGVPDQTQLDRLGGIPLISLLPRDPRGFAYAIKYATDRVFATVALVLTSPLLLVGAVGTMLTLGRPILFRQRRVGMDGHEFDMLKLRTMRDAPATPAARAGVELEPGIAPGGIEGEDRRTRFGAFLRATSFDELPQLFNVLRGDMSLIGPRPERPEFADRFARDVHRYADRLRVKSGITGWAQVHGLRGKTSLADRVEWDNYYIENWSLWLDFKIVLLTILAIFRDRSE